MLRTLAAIVAVTSLAPSVAQAEGGAAQSFSHGPSIPLIKINLEEVVDEDGKSETDATAEALAAGAGYSFNFNFLPNTKGDIRWLSLGVPVFLSTEDGLENVTVATGLTVGTFNNLFSLGVTYDLVKVEEGPGDSGLFLGPETTNLSILVNVGFNFGSGTDTKKHALPQSQKAPPPPNYFSPF